MNISCSAEPCPVILNSTCVFYAGANLIYTGISTNDNLQLILQKIDNKFKDAGLGYIFQNGVIQVSPGAPVKLGGSLNQDTSIDSNGFTFALSGTIESSSFITTGGTSSQFVKGDGSLDSTTYQIAGNYITALTGDGTAVGPGSAAFTLANTGVIANTYGSTSQVPVITVDAKGRVTNVTNTAISYPAALLLFSGDVTGAGLTGANVTLTLNTVNSGVFPAITPLKFSVNAKGLVTGAAALTNLDIFALIGYTPVPQTRTLTINGQTYDLSANRSWTVSGLPSQTGNAGKYLKTDGSIASWQTVDALPTQTGNGGKFLTTNGTLASWSTIPLPTPAALTKTDDTNITLTLTGSPSTSLLQAVGIAVGWTGTLADSRIASAATWNAKQDAITLTTTGTSGAATFIANTLNIPQYTDQFTGTVTSVGLSMPSAFTVTNSPVTSSGTLTVTGAGTASQYVRGDGQLATLPSSPSGGGASISYYLNGSIPSSVATYEQMSKTPVFGTGTDYTTSSNGLIAQFLTDVGDPAVINIPGGAWLIDLYFSANSAGGSPNFYVELHKYDGSTFTLIASSVANAELITNGTAVDLYTTSLAVPATTLTLTDRLAIRVYVDCDGKTLTLHTEDNNLAQIVTTFSTGISALNGLIAQVQFLSTGTSGTDFNINSATNTHTFNLPVASATNTGKLSSTDWTTFNGKQDLLSGTGIVKSTGGTISYLTDNTANWDTAYTNRITSLTTTGTGAATLVSNVLNIPTPPAATFTSLTTTGSSGSSTLSLGVLNVPTYTLAGLGGQPQLNGTGFVKATGTTITYDNSTYITGNQTITLSGDVTGSGATSISTSIADTTVTGKTITGYVSGAGTVTATDTILQAIQKLNGNTVSTQIAVTPAANLFNYYNFY